MNIFDKPLSKMNNRELNLVISLVNYGKVKVKS